MNAAPRLHGRNSTFVNLSRIQGASREECSIARPSVKSKAQAAITLDARYAGECGAAEKDAGSSEEAAPALPCEFAVRIASAPQYSTWSARQRVYCSVFSPGSRGRGCLQTIFRADGKAQRALEFVEGARMAGSASKRLQSAPAWCGSRCCDLRLLC